MEDATNLEGEFFHLDDRWHNFKFYFNPVLKSFYGFEVSFRCYLCINLMVLKIGLDMEIWELQISTEFQSPKIKIK